MTTNVDQIQLPELLQQLRRLIELIDPLKAILAAEAKPDLTDRIERFLSEMKRIGDQVERAVQAMEADQDSRAAIQRIENRMEAQAREMENMAMHLQVILRLFRAPPDDLEQT